MKVEGGTTASAVLHKVKVKEETKECCAFQQATSTCIASTTPVPSSDTGVAVTVGSAGVAANVGASPATATTATVTLAVTSILPVATVISHQPTPTSTVDNNNDTFPVDLDLKTKNKVLLTLTSSSKEKPTTEENTAENRLSPNVRHPQRSQHQEYKTGSRSSDNDSPLLSQSGKGENEDAAAKSEEATTNSDKNGTTNAANCISNIFAGYGKLKRLLGTLIQFAMDISPDTGDNVRSLVLGLLSGSMSAEEFHVALQEATNFPLRGFVLPYLKHALPSLQKELTASARTNNQTCVQYLRSNESTVLEAVGLISSGESVEVFSENIINGNLSGTGNNSCSTHHSMRSNSSSNAATIQHGSNTNLHHYPGAVHAQKRRASDTSYYENGNLLEDGPMYGKRSTNMWSHHQLQHQQQPSDASPYCWYHPLHTSGGSIQNHPHTHGHVTNSVLPNLVQINQLSNFSGPPPVPQQQMAHSGGSNLDDEWKNIHVMLSCILGMVEKTKRALTILQRRGCSSPATAPPPAPNIVAAQNGNSTGNSGSNPSSSTNGSQVESSTGDRDGNLKRLSGEIVAQTIRATEDRVAEVKRKAEEAVQEVKRAAVAEMQRAVAVAVAESRASERFRAHRYLDLPLSQRNPASIRPFVRAPGHNNANVVEANNRIVTTSITTASCEDEKDNHLINIAGSSCWNCGRPALETCGGCGIARYCGSFCQLRDWETGGHHANCSSVSSQDRRRSSSRSPPRIVSASGSANESDNKSTIATTVTLKGK